MFIFLEYKPIEGDPNKKQQQTQFNTSGIKTFVKNNNITLTTDQHNLLNNNTTLTRQQTTDLLGDNFSAFERWYDDTYLKTLGNQQSIASLGRIQLDQNLVNAFFRNIEEDKRRNRNRDMDIAKKESENKTV